jgi:hypothetical protein
MKSLFSSGRAMLWHLPQGLAKEKRANRDRLARLTTGSLTPQLFLL